MNISANYDQEHNILHIRFDDSQIEDSAEIEVTIIADYDANGRVVGLEILDASALVTGWGRSLQQALAGLTRYVSELWDELDRDE